MVRRMRLKAQLLAVVDAYASATGAPDSRVSRLLFGSGNRIRWLRHGRDMLSANVEDALQQLSDSWPEGAAWPCSVSRPAPRPLPVLPPAPAPAARPAALSLHGAS